MPAINSNSNDALLIKEERPYEEHASGTMAYMNSEAIIMMDETAENSKNDSQSMRGYIRNVPA